MVSLGTEVSRALLMPDACRQRPPSDHKRAKAHSLLQGMKLNCSSSWTEKKYLHGLQSGAEEISVHTQRSWLGKRNVRTPNIRLLGLTHIWIWFWCQPEQGCHLVHYSMWRLWSTTFKSLVPGNLHRKITENTSHRWVPANAPYFVPNQLCCCYTQPPQSPVTLLGARQHCL